MAPRKMTKTTDVKTKVEEKEIVKEQEIEVKKTTVKKEEKPKTKTFNAGDAIACRSITIGKLFMDGMKTNMVYEWQDYGDYSDVEYRDLVAAVRSKSPYIFNPNIIIEDVDFIEEQPMLKKFYSEHYTVREISNILNQSVDDMVESIKVLPGSAKEVLKNIAAAKVADGTLDSRKKINALDEIFGTNLSLVSETFQ